MNSHPSITASAWVAEHEVAVRCHMLQLAAEQITSTARRQLLPFICGLAVMCAAPLSAQVPGILSYQGRVLVGSTNFSGMGHFKFALANAAGTTTFWSHNGSLATSEPTNAVPLPVDKGLFAVNLGDAAVPNMTQPIPANVFENSAVHLKVWFSPDNVTFTALTPSLRIAANGYALNAAQAESVKDGAITAAKLAPNLALATTGSVSASTFNGSGAGLTNLNAAYLTGTLPDARLSVNVALLNSAPTFTGSVTAARFVGDGSGLTNIPGGIVGAGSIGMTQLADGAVTSAKLAANLSLITTGTITAGSFTGNGAGVTNLAATNLTGALIVTAAGNLGVGITSPEFKLDVNGGGRFQGDLPLVLQNPGSSEEGGKLVLADVGKSLTNAYDGAWMLDVVDTDYFRISRPDIYDVLTATRASKIVGLANDSLTVNSVNGRVGIGVDSPANKLEVNGTVKATAFVGDGSGLTNLAAATLSDGSVTTAKLADGSITGAKLSSSIAITTSGAVSAATFSGGGSGLTSLNAGNLSSGTLADARLSSNVPLLSGSPSFTGGVTASSFTGNGANLTNLSAANLAAGSLPDARLSANIPRLDTAATFTSTVTATAFTGNGASLTNLSAANLSSGTLADARLSSNVPLLTGSPTFTGTVTANSFTGNGANLTNLSAGNIASGSLADARLSSNIPRLNTAASFTSTVTATAFTGSGASLTNLSAANLSSGTLADARLSTNVPLLSGSQTFTGSPTFSGAVTMTTNLNVDSGTLYVDAANNRVGIGTATPTAPFELSGTANILGLLKSSSTIGTWLNLQNTSSGGATWNFVSTGSGNGEGAGRLLLRDNASGVRMTFDTAGNVGVGTTSPANKLDVAGTFQATGNATFGGTAAVAGNFTVDTTTLHVDAANNYVGIGTVTPIAMLHIKGTNDYLSIQNSVGSDIFSVDNNGRLALNTSVGTASTALIRAVSGDTSVMKVQNSSATDLFAVRQDGRVGVNNTYNNVGLNVRSVSGDTFAFNVETSSGGNLFNVAPGGNVGIGTTSPSAKLDVNGTVRCTTLTETSDRRLKHDIAPLGAMLEKVTALKPATYRYNADEPAQPVRIGFIAQDVVEVLPELVSNNADHLSLSYNGFGVVAIKAIQEQQAQIESLKAENAKKDTLLNDLAKRLAELEAKMK